MYDREVFYHKLLGAIDAPITDNNLRALRAWGHCEGSNAEYNPLDTTQHEEGATPYNSFGNNMHVWNYPDEDTGIRATRDTLNNGHYPHIVRALRDGSGGIVDGDARSELRVWGTNPDCIDEQLLQQQPPEPQKPPTHPVAFPTQQRENMQRVVSFLKGRHHRLTNADKLLLGQLKSAVHHAEGVQ